MYHSKNSHVSKNPKKSLKSYTIPANLLESKKTKTISQETGEIPWDFEPPQISCPFLE
jgi:phage host-nuclease inhibitor protein Gam